MSQLFEAWVDGTLCAVDLSFAGTQTTRHWVLLIPVCGVLFLLLFTGRLESVIRDVPPSLAFTAARKWAMLFCLQ